MIFPGPSVPRPGTRLVLDFGASDGLPRVRWVGVCGPDVAVAGAPRGTALLVEQASGTFARPGLRGHRLADADAADARDVAGRDWSPRFAVVATHDEADRLRIEAVAAHAALALVTEVETLAGGSLRIRHALTNTGSRPYLLDGLDVTVPAPDTHTEWLDFTGRHEGERSPQRGPVRDGLWLREGRQGRPGLDAASMIVSGTAGFGFGHGECLAVHVGWSGNATLRLERTGADGTTLGGGEFLLPGEVTVLAGATYTTPWVYVAASEHGLDGLAAQWHAWQRTLPSHPGPQPVTLNVWEAVLFDHDQTRLTRLADLARAVGVERYVLDDGWFHGRRDDTAGLGDWWVDTDVWPQGLDPLVQHVRALGMEFGLWFEPEMINPDSELFRAHPDWILSTDGRMPLLHRNQLVLDLTNPEAWATVRDRMTAVLDGHDVAFVKWDHNRELLETGSDHHGGAPAAHAQTLAFYALLDDLRVRHPRVQWESCASGGGRIDLGVIERAERFWTSDMTDALTRQRIQRWTVQLTAPEYLGAHVAAPVALQTGRTFSLGFRAATALFGSFGIEWDLTHATAEQLAELAGWVALYKDHRALLHGGRTVRFDLTDPAVLAHGVVAGDGSAALLAHVQLDESVSNRGVTLHLPGLHATARYALEWVGPIDTSSMSQSPQLDPAGPTGGEQVSGEALARVGIWMPRRRPETITLLHLRRVG